MNTNQIARIAGLVGEPARAGMLLALMDDRALTALELAKAGNVGAPTASRHLAQLVDGGLLRVEQRGRHRFHRLASAEVAKVLEGLMQLSITDAAVPRRSVVTGPRDETLRLARTCYDHLAGRLGVAIASRLVEQGAIEFDGESGRVTAAAAAVFSRWGLSVEADATSATRAASPASSPSLPSRTARVDCRPCLDWSERRLHLAGRLGAQLCQHCLDRGWLRRRSGTRALAVTPLGAASFQGLLGAAAWNAVVKA